MRGPDLRAGQPVVVVVGALAPYTQILYEQLSGRLDRPLHVLACSARETARQWELDTARGYRFEVLPGLRWHRSSVSNLYINPSVIGRLHRLAPAVVIVNDFAPTMLMAAAAARLRGIPYGIRTDGVPETDPGRRSSAHRLMRRAMVPGASFGIGPSRGSAHLLESYGMAADRFARSPLFPAWQAAASPATEVERPYDVLFSGSLNEAMKGARFFTDVMIACRERGHRLKVRVVGDGPLRREMEERLAQAGVPARFDGFLQQAALAEAYASARLFHFPSRGDVWGIVVQEAMQSGTVVIASPHSGSARELVAPSACGLVLPLEREAWVAATLDMLDAPERRASLRRKAFLALDDYTPARAVDGYLDRLRPVLGGAAPTTVPTRSQGPKSTSSV